MKVRIDLHSLPRRAGLPLLLLAGLVVSVAWADQSDERLDALFEVLVTTDDAGEAHAAEMSIWRIWIASGREDVDALMTLGVEAMTRQRIDQSIEFFDRIVDLAPGFSEGWNKRATAYYLNDDYVASVRDIERTLALEPRHFGAISGMGLIFLARGDDAGALQAFEEVLKIHPHALGAQIRVQQLRKKLRESGV